MRQKKTTAKKTPRRPSARRVFFINFIEVFLLILVALFFCRPEWLQHNVEQTVGPLFSLGAARGFKIAMLYGLKALYITIYTIFVHYLFVFLGNFDLRLTMKSDFRIGAGVLLVAFFVLVNSVNSPSGLSREPTAWSRIPEGLVLFTVIVMGCLYTYVLQRRGSVFTRWYSIFHYFISFAVIYLYSVGAIFLMRTYLFEALKL